VMMRPLGAAQRMWGLLVVGAGLLTFFFPLITTDPPVLGRAHWSPLLITVQMCEGQLPRSHGMNPVSSGDVLFSIPLMFTAMYLLDLAALVALFLSPYPKLMRGIAWAELCMCWAWRGDRRGFELLFYGTFSYREGFSLVRHVSIGQLTFILVAVMGVIWLLSMEDHREAEDAAGDWATAADGAQGSRPPETLDAEIISSDDDKRLPRENRRLRE
jgi:hypothetical protein